MKKLKDEFASKIKDIITKVNKSNKEIENLKKKIQESKDKNLATEADVNTVKAKISMKESEIDTQKKLIETIASLQAKEKAIRDQQIELN